jgi:hypothetical protein
MMEIVFNIFVINKSSRVKIYKEYNTNKYACKSRQCARSSRPGACPLRRARTDPNPLPRKRRDPGWGRGGQRLHRTGGHRRPRLDPGYPAQRGCKGCAPMACGPEGPTGWVGGGIPGQPLPGLPAGTSALTSRRL